MKSLLRRSPLSYPGGNPGFDSTHMASYGVHFSGVATGSGFINLLNSKAPAAATSVTYNAGPYGPQAVFNGSTFIRYDNLPTNTVTLGGTAAIIYTMTAGSTEGIFTNDGAGLAEIGMFPNWTGGNFMVRNGSTNYQSSIPCVLNVPYFAATSSYIFFDGVNHWTITNLVVLRLDTGQIQTFTNSDNTGSATMNGNGTTYIGQWSGGFGSTGTVCAAMHSDAVLNMNQLVQWAQDPWLFWYPLNINLLSLAPPISSTTNIGGTAKFWELLFKTEIVSYD